MSTSTHQPPPSSSSHQRQNRRGGRGMHIQVPPTHRPKLTSSSAQSRTSHFSSATLPHRNTTSMTATNTSTDLFHHRQASVADVPLPSHRPPTTFHSLQVDLKAQDVFREYLNRRNPKIRILYPGEDAFEMNRQDMWNHDDICTPCLILQPKYPKEISDICKAYTKGVTSLLRANHFHGTSLAIPRLIIAGGRNSMFGMKEGSIVLDLSRMRAVQVHLKSDVGTGGVEHRGATCTVQGGARVEDVMETLGELGYMAVTGMHTNLGIVGSILAGGYGYASRQYGLACDNVLAAQVILSDGRLKDCNPTKHDDLFWSLKGGGGGIGVVVNVTLRIYPIRHAALLQYSLLVPGPDVKKQRSMVLRHWANWIAGDVDNENVAPDEVLVPRVSRSERDNDGFPQIAPNEVYSQLCLTTDSTSVQFLGTSIDTKAISQSDGFLDMFHNKSSRKGYKKRGPFAFLGNNNKSEPRVPMGWNKIDGLADLINDKFGMVSRSNPQFTLVRYDELHEHGTQGLEAGNLYIALKYVKSLTNQIIHYLVQATTDSSIIPNGDCRIHIMSLGGKIKEIEQGTSAFYGRNMNYVIFIEGKWNAVNRQKGNREKAKVKNWVDVLVKQLHRCPGVQSTAHPESARDQVRKSGKRPPKGWYNFDEDAGKRLAEIKNKRDPRKVFSLSTRVSWTTDLTSNDSIVAMASIASLGSVEVIKDGEINPSDCLSPINRKEHSTRSMKSFDSDSDQLQSSCGDDQDTDTQDYEEGRHDGKAPGKTDDHSSQTKNDTNDKLTDDMKRLLSMSESEDDLKDWILPSVSLHNTDTVDYDDAAISI